MPTSSWPATLEAPRRRPITGVEPEEITTAAGLEALGPEWERLWALATQATPFQSPHWLLPWWQHLGRGTLASLALRDADEGRLVGLAPFYVYRDAEGARHLLPIGIATSDYLDLLVQPGWQPPVLAAVAAYLAGHRGDWDSIELPQLRRGAALLGLAAAAGWQPEIAAAEPSPVLTLNPSALPPAMAANLRYCRNRALRSGALAYQTADAATLPQLLAALLRLHRRRWRERGQPGLLDDPGVQAAQRQAAPLLHAAGLLRLHALRLDGQIIAIVHCLADPAPAHRRRCYYYLGGFDPRWRALAPGTLLLAHAMAQAAAEGATRFDFLRGREAYKYRWGAVDEPAFTLRLRPAPAA